MAKVFPDGWRELKATGAAECELHTLDQFADHIALIAPLGRESAAGATCFASLLPRSSFSAEESEQQLVTAGFLMSGI